MREYCQKKNKNDQISDEIDKRKNSFAFFYEKKMTVQDRQTWQQCIVSPILEALEKREILETQLHMNQSTSALQKAICNEKNIFSLLRDAQRVVDEVIEKGSHPNKKSL